MISKSYLADQGSEILILKFMDTYAWSESYTSLVPTHRLDERDDVRLVSQHLDICHCLDGRGLRHEICYIYADLIKPAICNL